MQKRKKIYLLLVVFLLVIGSLFVWWYQNQQSKIKVDWDSPDYVFDIKIPDDFDQTKKDRLELKLTEARKAYAEKKEDNYTWDIIGNMYEFVRDYDRALVAYQKSVAKQPKDVIAILNIATIYEEQKKDYQEAEKYYSQAVVIFPQMSDLYQRLANLYWHKMNKLQEAETTYVQGIEQTSNKPELITSLINFYEKTGQIDKQKASARKLLELYPDNEVYKKDYGYLVK
ncbi:MAG: tetratricopeptide repeat protein [Patescibacteria group bacterium]|jgi:tetratricopeptide (TPR) repeat protein